jgi:quinol monooxygenase YgiN
MRCRSLVPCIAAIAGVLVLGGLFVSSVSAQKKPHPIAVMVKENLKDPSKPFTLLVRFQAKEGAEAKLEAAFAKATKATRKEKGNLRYELNRDLKMPSLYILYERWQDLASLEAHLQSAHIATLLTEVNELRAAPPEAQILVPVEE